MKRLLVVQHTPTDNLGSIADATLAGARHPDLEGVEVRVLSALEAGIDDVLAADGYLLGTPANFGYISGAMKHFFDTVYDHVREPTAKRPYSYWIHGGYDTTGAERAMEQITTGLGWNLVAEPLVFTGEVTADRLEAATELGGTVAAMVAG